MPKRSAQEKLEGYRRKILKLEEKEKRKKTHRRSRCPLESSDDEINEDSNELEYQDMTEPLALAGSSRELDNEMTPVLTAHAQNIITPDPEPDTVAQPSSVETAQPAEVDLQSEVSLDPELLSALGAATSDTPDFGDKIHESLSKLWTPILRKGLDREDKDKLSKDYLLPNNCKLLQAPKLNAEISAAVTEVVRGRDKKLIRFQQQLGVGTAAINRAMDTLLTSDNKIMALKQLSDGCRYLTDLHFLLTKDRIKLITPSLEKSFLTVIQDTERDETLFGSTLSEKIKASQAINKQSSQIKARINQKATSSTSGFTQLPALRPVQGNWSGPPRYLSNRGGRGGQQSQSKTSNHSKSRATPTQ